MDLEGKVAVITGGSTGIGKATAVEFQKKGANVYVLGLHSPDIESINFLPCDVSDYSRVEQAIQSVIEKEKRIDVLFANAGIDIVGTVEETSPEDLDRIIGVNVKGVFYALKSILPLMKKQGSGAIVLNCSDQSFIGKEKSAAYGLTKGAVGQLVKSTALDYAPFGVRVNGICPGTIDTPMYQSFVKDYSQLTGTPEEAMHEKMRQLQPLNRIGSPEEVARLVSFLVSDASPYITGTLIPIDGGYAAR